MKLISYLYNVVLFFYSLIFYSDFSYIFAFMYISFHIKITSKFAVYFSNILHFSNCLLKYSKWEFFFSFFNFRNMQQRKKKSSSHYERIFRSSSKYFGGKFLSFVWIVLFWTNLNGTNFKGVNIDCFKSETLPVPLRIVANVYC